MTDINFNDYAIQLTSGKHRSPQDGLCVMECVAYIAGEGHTDHPECADGLLTSMAIVLNDVPMSMETRQHYMLRFVLRLAGSYTSDLNIQEKRLRMLKNFLQSVAPDSFYAMQHYMLQNSIVFADLYEKDMYAEAFFRYVHAVPWGLNAGCTLLDAMLALTDPPNTTAEQVHLDRLRQLAEQHGSAPAAKGTTQPKELA